MKVVCPHCSKKLSVPDSAAGKRGRCPGCGNAMDVPAVAPNDGVLTKSPGRPDVHVDSNISPPAPPTELIAAEQQLPTDATTQKKGALRSLVHKMTTDEQDPKIVERVQHRVQEILMTGEELLYIAVQNKPVVKFAPDCVVLTNKRFIVYHPKVTGRVTFEDYVWRELSDCRIEEGIMGATISIRTALGKKLSIDYLPKPQARQIYRAAQEQEEIALEERRQRNLESSRASAGGVVVQTAMTTPHENGQQPKPPDAQEDPMSKLQQLKSMLDAGLIEQGEYDKKKADILSRM